MSIDAKVIEFIQISEPYLYPAWRDGPELLSSTNVLVVLQTFAKGEVHQLPINFIKIVDEHPTYGE